MDTTGGIGRPPSGPDPRIAGSDTSTKENTMFKTTTLAASIALLAGSAFAQVAVNPMGPLDADNDGLLTQEEFAPARDFGAQFVALDSDGDGFVSQAEYNEGIRTLADTENDNDLNDRELQRYDELARMFDNEVADRDNLLLLFGIGTDDTETGSITE